MIPISATQLSLVSTLYEELLVHHGVEIGRRHARKHLASALDVAAACTGAPAPSLKQHREAVLTAARPDETLRNLSIAFESFGNAGKSTLSGPWRAAA